MEHKLTNKERMQIPKQSMPEQKPEVRKHDFSEVPLGYPEQAAIEEAKRCIEKCKAPCVPGCPVGIDIPAFVRLVEQGEFAAAARKIKETNILPAICGRVCPQADQCEGVCVIKKRAEPVAIGRLERFVADYERTHGLAQDPVVAPPTGKRVAIIGSGPAGITAASELAQRGHQVTLFEALHRPGGVLIYGIPRFRLPLDVVDTELEYLKKMGVEIVCNAVVGRMATIDDLLADEYDAVFIATGAGLPYFLDIPGENLNGVYSANEFLTRVNLMGADRFPDFITPVFLGKKVAVIGAGDTAMDASRTAMRLGPEKVTVYYRRTRAEAPSLPQEMQHAMEEGVEFQWLTAPVRFVGSEDYFVTHMECLRMELAEVKTDKLGTRRSVKPIPGSEFQVEADTVIFALGFGVNPVLKETTPGLETNKWGIIGVDDKMRTSRKGVFAGGDIITGGSTVISAMGQAKIGAAAMHEYLMSGVWKEEELPAGKGAGS